MTAVFPTLSWNADCPIPTFVCSSRSKEVASEFLERLHPCLPHYTHSFASILYPEIITITTFFITVYINTTRSLWTPKARSRSFTPVPIRLCSLGFPSPNPPLPLTHALCSLLIPCLSAAKSLQTHNLLYKGPLRCCWN